MPVSFPAFPPTNHPGLLLISLMVMFFWTRPDKHPRGNILDEFQGMKRITPYGPEYLK
jgi:hypothetical protein